MVHPWHCPLDCPRHSDTSSYFTSSTRANLSSWSWQTTHLCVNGLSEEREEGQKWERGGAERGESRRKCGSEEDTSHHIRGFLRVISCLKGPILPFTRPLAIPPTSTFVTRCQLTHLSNWTAHCLGLSYITAPYTASVKWKRIKELKEWIENVDLEKFILPHKTVASRAVKGHVHDDQLVDDDPAWHVLFFLKYLLAEWHRCVCQRGGDAQAFPAMRLMGRRVEIRTDDRWGDTRVLCSHVLRSH